MGLFWLYFNGAEHLVQREHDQLHAMASACRPARRSGLGAAHIPHVEILGTKPEYENWLNGASAAPVI